MSSYLFSPLCLDPLTGVIAFTADAKPFRTKIVQADISILFTDTIKVAITEQLHFNVDQLFHTHTGNCKTEPISCTSDGFESEVYDDFGLGFEPTISYTIAEYPPTAPTAGQLNFIGYSAAGTPVFVVPEMCGDPESSCPEGFETSSYDIADFESSDPECTDTCNHVYVGPCSSQSPGAMCTDASPTTLSTTFAEFLTITDGPIVYLDMLGSLPFNPIYAYDPAAVINLDVVTVDNQALFPG